MRPLALIMTVTLLSTMAVSARGSSPEAGASSAEWVQRFEYDPDADDAGAFFFRFETESTRCIAFRLRLTFSEDATTPWIVSKVHGTTQTITTPDGAVTKLDDPSAWSTWTQRHESPDDSHLLVNASAGNVIVHRIESTSGYDAESPTRWLEFGTTSCSNEATPTERWVAIVSTAQTVAAEVSFAFYEDWSLNGSQFDLVPGDAKARVVMGAESNRTFFRELKDFDGTFGYDGDPLGLGSTNAAGVNLESRIQTTRGFSGGFLDVGWNQEASALSYAGPNGEAGAGTDVTPGSPVPKRLLSHIAGSPGEWTFRANAYAAPGAHSSLFLWGADIETRHPDNTELGTELR